MSVNRTKERSTDVMSVDNFNTGSKDNGLLSSDSVALQNRSSGKKVSHYSIFLLNLAF